MKPMKPTIKGCPRRAGTRGAKANNSRRLSIEGESITVTELAARLGIGSSTASFRLKREQQKPGPVTWAGLRLPGGKQ